MLIYFNSMQPGKKKTLWQSHHYFGEGSEIHLSVLSSTLVLGITIGWGPQWSCYIQPVASGIVNIVQVNEIRHLQEGRNEMHKYSTYTYRHSTAFATTDLFLDYYSIKLITFSLPLPLIIAVGKCRATSRNAIRICNSHNFR